MLSVYNRLLALARSWRYPGSLRYWERRYARGGDSGPGSSGRLAAYKADWLNRFVRENNIRKIVEFGCGDGRQLLLAEYPGYLGLDIAPSAIKRCEALFSKDNSKQFRRYDPFHFDPATARADLALSLEVLFHLTEETIYRLYLEHLFAASEQWVVIFAPDAPDCTGGQFPHIRIREFTKAVPAGWQLRCRETNPHRDISMSDFFVFEKC